MDRLRDQGREQAPAGPHGLSAGAAAQEAVARAGERIEASSQAEYLIESNEENTNLRDALQSAVITTAALAR